MFSDVLADGTFVYDSLAKRLNMIGACIVLAVFLIIFVINIIKTIKALRNIAKSSEIITNHIDIMDSNIETMAEIQRKQSGIVSISRTPASPASRGRRTYK